MPPRSSKRKAPAKKGTKGKAAEPVEEIEVDAEAIVAEESAPAPQPAEDVEMNGPEVEEEVEEQPKGRKTRGAAKAAAAPPSKAKGKGKLKDAVEKVVEEVEEVVEAAAEKASEVAQAAETFVEEMTGVEASGSGSPAEQEQGSGVAEPASVVEKVAETATNVAEAAQEFVEEMTGIEENSTRQRSQSSEAEAGSSKPKPTMEERRAKMEELRKKMAAGTKANRQSLAEESAKAKLNARELARLERQRKLAETLRLKADAEERGEDAERQKNWEYTIEENDEWEKKLARKKRRADFEFHDDAHAARRRYKKDLDQIKPDLEAYNAQKAVAMGLNPSSNALTTFSSTSEASSSAIRAVTSEEQRIAAENLYRDANTLIYGDNKPSEDAIDRVVGKINKDIEKKAKFHRKRVNEEEGDITYINEHNRVFNKKIARYYDKYTTEIRASFERGTAL